MSRDFSDLMRALLGVEPSQARAYDLHDLGRFIAITEFGASPRLWLDKCRLYGADFAARAALLIYGGPDMGPRGGSKLSNWLNVLNSPPIELVREQSILDTIRGGAQAGNA